MTAKCERITWPDLTDYAAGDLPPSDVEPFEAHLFTCPDCGARAAQFEALVQAIGSTARAGAVGGLVTDAVLNRLARDGVRLRTYALSPGDAVPCAVWDDDDLLALRLRGNFAGVREVAVSQHVGGTAIGRVIGFVPDAAGEVILATPASWIRELPVVEVDIHLSAIDEHGERPIASYRLLHGGSLQR